VTLDNVGIVVIGRNEGSRLTDCLNSIAKNSINAVYVDSGSADGSPMVAERLGIPVVNLDNTEPFTAARARNEGYAALRITRPNMRYIQFVDGDCQLAASWIEAALTFIEGRSDIAIVCGRRRERYPEASTYNQLCDIEWNTPPGESISCGGDALMRAEAFDMVGGFRPKLIAGEEPDLCARLTECGWKIWRLDVEMTVHDVAMTRFRQWWVRAVRSGYGFIEVHLLNKQAGARPFSQNIRRAIIWGGILPAIILLGCLMSWKMLFGVVIYPLQAARIAYRRGFQNRESWLFGLFMMLARFAELQGILSYFWRRWRGRKVELIEYKTA
jgi:glycosyltransferase involved in cell wall biosynthesis